jgi:hypothetical protein
MPDMNYQKHKETPELGRLLVCKSKMVRECDVRWNSVEASLILFYPKMLDLGFTFSGNNVVCLNREEVVQ